MGNQQTKVEIVTGNELIYYKHQYEPVLLSRTYSTNVDESTVVKTVDGPRSFEQTRVYATGCIKSNILYPHGTLTNDTIIKDFLDRLPNTSPLDDQCGLFLGTIGKNQIEYNTRLD